LSLGASGWPYQVTGIEIVAGAAEQGLMPRAAGPGIEQGFRETKKFCLTCNQVRGTGGKKYEGDLVQTACRWRDEKLKDWIRDPGALRPGTSMPGLNRGLPTVEREAAIDRIVAYLRAVSAEDSACSARP
jgi:hypothetical protein